MKSKLLAAVIFVFLLCGVAAAQDEYYIRTNARINLRATYDLEAEKVETVEIGTILQVVGRFNRWLKIERDGQTVWMADWVHYTRVDDGSQEQISIQESPDPGSNQVVDNCCFVDRQCATEQEWAAGYLAFQNQQCVAPAGFTVDSGRGYPPIQGSELFVRLVEKALAHMAGRAPNWYAYVVSAIDLIREIPNGAWVFSGRRIVEVSVAQDSYFNYRSTHIWLGLVFVHEACHIHRTNDPELPEGGYGYHGEELICTQKELDASLWIDPDGIFRQYLLSTIANHRRQQAAAGE